MGGKVHILEWSFWTQQAKVLKAVESMERIAWSENLRMKVSIRLFISVMKEDSQNSLHNIVLQ